MIFPFMRKRLSFTRRMDGTFRVRRLKVALVLEDVPDVGGMLMSVSELDAGESESVRFQCRRDSTLEAEHVELTYTISRENDGGFYHENLPGTF